MSFAILPEYVGAVKELLKYGVKGGFIEPFSAKPGKDDSIFKGDEILFKDGKALAVYTREMGVLGILRSNDVEDGWTVMQLVDWVKERYEQTQRTMSDEGEVWWFSTLGGVVDPGYGYDMEALI